MEDCLQALLRALDVKGSMSPRRSTFAIHRRMSTKKRLMDGVIKRTSVPAANSSMRWAQVDGSRKNVARRIQARVRALRKLVPNGDSDSLDKLFREAADYIACLQSQVKIMQVMVDVLSGGDV